MINGKMYKVLAPIEGADGKTTHWSRVGSGFTNKDESLNLYLDTLPLGAFAGKQLKLQIREYDEDDLRRRDDRRRSGNGSSLSTTDFPMADRQGSLDHAPF